MRSRSVLFLCLPHRSPRWRPCFPGYARWPPGWTGGCPLAEVSGRTCLSKFVPTSRGSFSQDQEPWSSWLARAARLSAISSFRGEIPSSQDVRSTVPAEEVALLRYSLFPRRWSIFPSPLLDSALTKMRAAANDALVQRTLHPPRIPRKPVAGGGSSSTGSAQASSSGASRPAQKQSSTSSPSGQSGKKRKSCKGKALFSSSSGGSGRSGGKGKGAGKKST